MSKKHASMLISLDIPELGDKAVKEHALEIFRSLQSFFKTNLSHPQNCPSCGGIVPELSFRYKGKSYFFTCYMITENSKVKAQTDYQKFAEYYKAVKEKKE
jgi:hypothetical protein